MTYGIRCPYTGEPATHRLAGFCDGQIVSTVFVTEAYIDRAGEALLKGLQRHTCRVAFVRVEREGQPIRVIEPEEPDGSESGEDVST